MTIKELLKSPHFWEGFRQGLLDAFIPAVLCFVFCLWVLLKGGFLT